MASDRELARFADFLAAVPAEQVACGVCRQPGRLAPLGHTLTMASAGGGTTSAFFAAQCPGCGHTVFFSAGAPAFRGGDEGA